MQCYGYIITFGSSKSLKRCICNEAISTITIYESIYRDTGPIGGGGGRPVASIRLLHRGRYFFNLKATTGAVEGASNSGVL